MMHTYIYIYNNKLTNNKTHNYTTTIYTHNNTLNTHIITIQNVNNDNKQNATQRIIIIHHVSHNKAKPNKQTRRHYIYNLIITIIVYMYIYITKTHK